jgi:hypothetical protein
MGWELRGAEEAEAEVEAEAAGPGKESDEIS